jgi:hypothetical protein
MAEPHDYTQAVPVTRVGQLHSRAVLRRDTLHDREAKAAA